MAGRDGNGNFTYSYPDFVAGTTISSSEMDANNADAATALTQSIAVDGQSTVTANIPLATYKLTGLGAGSAATDSLTLGQAQANAYTYQGTDSGAADAYVIALVPAITSQGAGLRVTFVAANDSTGASTLNAGGGEDAIEYQGGALGGAEIAAGSTVVCEHDGTAWQMTSPSALLVGTAGLGTAAVLDAGVADTNVPQMDSTGYPAADGSQITGIVASDGSVTVAKLATGGLGQGEVVISSVTLTSRTATTYADVADSTFAYALSDAANTVVFLVHFDGQLAEAGSTSSSRTGSVLLYDSTDAADVGEWLIGRGMAQASANVATSFFDQAMVANYAPGDTDSHSYKLRIKAGVANNTMTANAACSIIAIELKA